MFRSVMWRFVLPVAFASCVGRLFRCRISTIAWGVVSSTWNCARNVKHSMESRCGSAGQGRRPGWRVSDEVTPTSGCSPFWCASGRYDDIQDRTHSSALPARRMRPKSPAEAHVVQLPSGSVQDVAFDFRHGRAGRFSRAELHDLSFVDRRQRRA